MQQRPASGLAMLLVTVFLMAAVMALAFLSGPFGRTPTIREQPVPSHAP
jgi:hypothetical protein